MRAVNGSDLVIRREQQAALLRSVAAGERRGPDALFSFWAKSGVPTMHSVAHHSLDVAAVCQVLLPILRAPISVPDATLVALVALHDIGKFSRPFQAKLPALWPPCLGIYAAAPAGWAHDKVGYAMLKSEQIWPHLQALFPAGRANRWSSVLGAVAGHHGRPPAEPQSDLPRSVACQTCFAAAGAFVDAVLDVLAPAAMPRLTKDERARLTWWLAGLTTLADWIGSSRAWFPAVAALDHTDLAAYWHQVAVPQAKHAVAASGLLPSSVTEPGLKQLFPAIHDARPLQVWAGSVEVPDGPGLFVIEDVTGAGKTEAALVLAHRLMASGRGHGLYFALPTMATANAMYRRLEQSYEKLFDPLARPSLVLAHGRRMLNSRFTDSILPTIGDRLPESDEPGDEPGGAQCAAWIADDRRKAFLAEIGVGTIDQALLAVLPSRHAMLRLLGLSQRVLIIDEAHAYGAYEGEELLRLLRFHAGLGGSAIILSATLTASQRRALGDAFLAGLGLEADAPNISAYPLATVVSAKGVRHENVSMTQSLKRQVAVIRVATEAAAADALTEAARSGAAVAWVRNSVGDAIAASDLLRARGLTPIVFHARFAMGDRLRREEEVLEIFGVGSTPMQRRGRVLVATQVVEQSLDLDFDLVVSDLAPADLVIQRAGRLWRHRRDHRPIQGPNLLLLAPDPIDDPPENWLGSSLRRTGFVYVDHSLLWRSARALLAAGAITTPDNVRALVEAAYNHEIEPDGLARATMQADGKRRAARGVAWQNLLTFDQPYQLDAGLWAPDVHTPTRLGDPQTILRLARIRNGAVVPFCDDDDLRRAWSLSEVSVRTNLIAAAAPDEADPWIAIAKREWPRWEQEIPTIVLREFANDAFFGAGLDYQGRAIGLSYSRDGGLVPTRG